MDGRRPGRVRLSIVYLNFDRLAETRETTERLKGLVAGREDIEVLAADNGSGDGTGEYLRAQGDWLTAVLLAENLGIAGYNRAFEQARGEYVLVLDDDSHPESVETIDRALALLEADPAIGVVACDVRSADGRRQASWHLPEVQRAGPSMAFVGCGFFIRRELFRAIGWYPERFFLYQNEMEVAIGVRRRGYRIHYLPQCRVVHRGDPASRPGRRRVYYATRNTLWLIRRHYPGPERWYLVGSRLVIGALMALARRRLATYARAARDGLLAPIEHDPMGAALRREFRGFARQNSLVHLLVCALRRLAT